MKFLLIGCEKVFPNGFSTGIALGFVQPVWRDGLNRASLDTNAARFAAVFKARRSITFSLGWCEAKRQVGDDAGETDARPPRCDQASVEAKTAEPGGVGDMSF